MTRSTLAAELLQLGKRFELRLIARALGLLGKATIGAYQRGSPATIGSL
jgi:hypothetical protein